MPFSPFVLQAGADVALALGRCPDALALSRRAVEVLPESLPDEARRAIREKLRRVESGCAPRRARAP